MADLREIVRQDGKVRMFRNGKMTWITEEEYIEDNLLFHSLIHVLSVIADKIDILEDKGYLFQTLKRQTNLFREEFFKHINMQVNLMHSMGNATFHNKTQKDFDFVLDFISEARPAKITMLAEIIRNNEELQNFSENQLVDKIINGEIEVEDENEGKSGIFKNESVNWDCPHHFIDGKCVKCGRPEL